MRFLKPSVYGGVSLGVGGATCSQSRDCANTCGSSALRRQRARYGLHGEVGGRHASLIERLVLEAWLGNG
jgi:hypothetical protein